MKTIDFDNTKPAFDNGTFKWYLADDLNDYLAREQAVNLPSIKGLACFVVKGNNIVDYVLIDDKQNVLDAYPYTHEGYGQMEAKINIIKISKHYDDHEKVNV